MFLRKYSILCIVENNQYVFKQIKVLCIENRMFKEMFDCKIPYNIMFIITGDHKSSFQFFMYLVTLPHKIRC